VLVVLVAVGAAGCTSERAGRGAVDPSGRASAWADEVMGAPVNVGVAIRIPKDARFVEEKNTWLATGPGDARIDVLAHAEGSSPHGWVIAVPGVRADSFDAIRTKSDHEWSDVTTLSSGVRVSCTGQAVAGCLFGFPRGGIVYVDVASAERARRVFARSAGGPPELTLPGDLYVSGWVDAPPLVATLDKPGQAPLAKGLEGSTFTLSRDWKMTGTMQYATGDDARRADEAYRASIAAALKDNPIAQSLLGAKIYDEHVDGSDLVVVVDFKALVAFVVDAIQKAFR
jgi:hypothetical protein